MFLEISIAVEKLFVFICGSVSVCARYRAVTDLVAHLAGIVILPYMVPYFILVTEIVSTLCADVVIRALAVVRLEASFRSEDLR